MKTFDKKTLNKMQLAVLPSLLKVAMFGVVTVFGTMFSQNVMADDKATDTATASQNSSQIQLIDGVVAIVNDSAILNSELEQAVAQTANQLQRQNQPMPQASVLYSQVLSQMINRQIQLDLIKRQGLSVDENQLNHALTNLAKKNGASSLSEFQQRLDSEQKGSYQALRQQIGDDLAIQALQQQQVVRRVHISEQDVDAFLKSPESHALQQSQYRPLHIRVPYGNKTGETVSERQKQQALKVANQLINSLQAEKTNMPSNIEALMQQAQQGYKPELQGGDVGYRMASELPTDIANDIISLQVGEVSKPLLTEQGIDIIKLIDKKNNAKHIIDQWQTRHILISPSASVSADMAKQQIDAIYQQLQQGADFATLASTYSSDTGSANNGGSLGWVSEGEMVAPFEAMMKQTAVNDFSIPFQSQFGWHILKVDGKRQQDVSGTYRRNMAKEILYQRLAPQALEDWMQELKAQSYIKIMQ
ncbi:peptidylprolyl isomerase [Faucicola boevrei]|uniref:peptidylprolyl isomerase n=1 Tax=Faucicola boevrei TaxID=346665 RepID=UPI000367F726|nr:peptidylprolyl isomerase [Moraxella boevrei]